MNVLAKFSIQSISHHRFWEKPGHAITLDLSASQGEPFGSATPSGSIKMTIVNPEAQKVFVDAWHEYTRGQRTKAPEFYVTFALDDEGSKPVAPVVAEAAPADA